MSALISTSIDPEGSSHAQGAARLLMCARCGLQVLLCLGCDRGQRYCSQACSAASRRESQRAAARRYQRSDAGRSAHAARSRRWRLARVAEQAHDPRVTHQGGCTEPTSTDAATSIQTIQSAELPTSRGWPDFRCVHCHSSLAPWVRQGLSRRARQRPRRRAPPSPTRAAAPGPLDFAELLQNRHLASE